MSTPGQGEGQPSGNPYGAGRSEPPPYGKPPPYAQQDDQFGYSPYGSPYPAGTGGEDLSAPVRRPGILWLGLVLIALSAAPFVLVGLVVAIQPLDASAFPPDLLARAEQQNLTAEYLISLLRGVGWVFVAVALLYVVLAAVAATGRNVARIIMAVLTVGFALLLLAAVVTVGGDTASLVLLGLILLAAVAGTTIYFLPAAREYYASRRR